MDEKINNAGYISVWNISDITNPQLIKRLSPGVELPNDFQVAHIMYSTPDGKYLYVESWSLDI